MAAFQEKQTGSRSSEYIIQQHQQRIIFKIFLFSFSQTQEECQDFSYFQKSFS